MEMKLNRKASRLVDRLALGPANKTQESGKKYMHDVMELIGQNWDTLADSCYKDYVKYGRGVLSLNFVTFDKENRNLKGRYWGVDEIAEGKSDLSAVPEDLVEAYDPDREFILHVKAKGDFHLVFQVGTPVGRKTLKEIYLIKQNAQNN